MMQLDDLGALEHARRLRGEPHHQHRAEREVRRVEDGQACGPRRLVGRTGLPPGRPDDDRDTGGEAGEHVRLDRVGPGEVDRGVAAGGIGVGDLVAGGRERGREHAADPAAAPVEGDLHG